VNLDYQEYLNSFMKMVVTYGPKLILAIVTLIIGGMIIGVIKRLFIKALRKVNFDSTLEPYLAGILATLFKVILYISVIDMIGVETTSFVAVIGAAGLAVGLALQGSLGNFAGGVLILIFKPIKKGDLIEAQGVLGVVESIQPFVTELLSPDNIIHFIPNGALSSGTIKNYSVHQERRVDLTFGIGYGDSIDEAKKVLMDVAKNCPNTHTHLAPIIFVNELADSSVNIAVKVFCTPALYWDVFAHMQEHGKKALDNAKISIPFPQRDVHVIKDL